MISLLLAQADDAPFVFSSAPSPVVYVAIGAGALLVGAAIAYLLLKSSGAGAVAAAKKQADEIISKANGEAMAALKQAEQKAREDAERLRGDFAKETETTRKDLENQRKEAKENTDRLTKREEALDKERESLAGKEKQVRDTEADVRKREAGITDKLNSAQELLKRRQDALDRFETEKRNELLRITNLSAEDAKKEALAAVERQCQAETGAVIKRVTEQAQEEAKEKAQRITLQAIQRYASEHTAESTTASVDIPGDEMKGRIIGREGRNIRAFEKITGVDVIVDDTPGVVTISCFDPVRRAIAAESLRRLIDDGRVHPARIEEIFKQVGDEFTAKIIKFGKDACLEANLNGLHPRISEMMGRLYYRTSYGQNILRHSMEVAYLCQVIAAELGLDPAIARRCGFLHDIGKAMDHEQEGGHPAIGMEFCKKNGEKEEVLNAVGGHHDDIPHTTPYTAIVMAADAISGARPGARRETLEKYVKRLEQLEGIAKAMRGVREVYAIQAGRELRVIVDPERLDDVNCHVLARDIAKKVSDEMNFPGEIKISVMREMRTVEYAR